MADMADAGAHETDALNALNRNTGAAQVHAILALAAAIDRLAKAQETIAWAQPPS
jgi:hypothetical protein